MTAVGVAAVAAFEVVNCGENEVWAFVVEVFRSEFWCGLGWFLRVCAGGFGFVWHYKNNLITGTGVARCLEPTAFARAAVWG